MTLQYANRELPCPLCLLERVALFGICFGALANFRHGFGSAIFGIHMPVWSIIIAVTVLAAYAVKLVILGGDAFLRNADVNAFPQIKRGADAFGLYVIGARRGESRFRRPAVRSRRVPHVRLPVARRLGPRARIG